MLDLCIEEKSHKVHDHAWGVVLLCGLARKLPLKSLFMIGCSTPNGQGGRHLRRDLWAIFWKIYSQGNINESYLGEMVELKFKKSYKLRRTTQKITLGHL